MDLHPSNCEAKLIFTCSVFLEGILSSWLRSVCFLGYVYNVARGDSARFESFGNELRPSSPSLFQGPA